MKMTSCRVLYTTFGGKWIVLDKMIDSSLQLDKLVIMNSKWYTNIY